ncbi:hypothetical protein K450DRAFT_230888 [Umbelopsis ramanniana AG]|uniref:Uncharacterized protein n=1 Tax=Umbelopsis ramanniana AG TaxID=1314678 RepID=A0AAD5ED60_UMBRA|nr:uncharacterized protein K450DRAFT_230888 [Umbelopsis ramanniana AG]KAI8581728.1 hypothetical protein K450DRAFT_230888 [Umbelopsis ramanniana AG]
MTLYQFSSIYTSPLVVTEFFPVIFKFDGERMMASESYFWDMYSTTMQAINFYYYLLISDEKNKSIGVKSKDTVAFVEKNFLQGIKEALNHYLDTYHEKKKEFEGHVHSGDHTHTADSKSSPPISSYELGGIDEDKLTATEELELINSRVMNLSIMQDVLDRVQALLDS